VLKVGGEMYAPLNHERSNAIKHAHEQPAVLNN
jgi:hypothetical protein